MLSPNNDASAVALSSSPARSSDSNALAEKKTKMETSVRISRKRMRVSFVWSRESGAKSLSLKLWGRLMAASRGPASVDLNPTSGGGLFSARSPPFLFDDFAPPGDGRGTGGPVERPCPTAHDKPQFVSGYEREVTRNDQRSSFAPDGDAYRLAPCRRRRSQRN